MSTINSVLDIAKNSLLANQKSISVASHNIANANTEGYSRQRAVLESSTPINQDGQYFGTGVEVSQVQRIFDKFKAVQLRDAGSQLSRHETKNELLTALENSLDELGTTGLTSHIDKFFNSFQDVANNPESYSERAALLTNADAMASRFGDIDTVVKQTLTNTNQEIQTLVGRVNNLTGEIADLNERISSVEVSGVTANDLRDRRQLVLGELSEIVNINTLENDTGKVNVYITGGLGLVTGAKTTEMTVTANRENPYLYDIVVNDVVVNDDISGGKLKGTIEGNEYYREVLDKVDRLAASIIKEVNVQHRSGYGLDGSTGQDLFSAHSVYTGKDSANTGGAEVSTAIVTDQSALTLEDYEIRFTGPGAYRVVNASDDSIVTTGAYTSGSAITFEGLSVTISDTTGAPAAGDKFEVSVTKDASKYMSVALTDPNKLAASATSAGLPGDNVNALAIADLKEKASVGGSTFNDYYSGIIADLGIASRDAKTAVVAQEHVVRELSQSMEGHSGVSLEEEAVELVKLQNAYQAAAKVMRTANELFETLLRIT